MSLKNIIFFIIIFSAVLLISTSSVYGCLVDDTSVNDENLNMNVSDGAFNNDDGGLNGLEGVSVNDGSLNDLEGVSVNDASLDDVSKSQNINSDENFLDSKTGLKSIKIDIIIDENSYPEEDTNASATFDELDREIQNLKSGDTLDIDKDYYVADDSIYLEIPITIATNNIIINGNGHTIDGRNLSAIFNVAGYNVTIRNLIFINGDYHNSSRFNYELSPILWAGDYGIISNCTFSGNKAIRGGAITWCGSYGLINNTKFENNFAYTVGGAIYLLGHDNGISNCIFTNSCSRSAKESIFSDCLNGRINISDNIFDNETFFNDCLNNSDIEKYYINGSKINININILSKSHLSWVADKKIDIIPVIYLCIMNRYLFYDENTMFFNEYNGTDFILNFIRSLGNDVIYTKSFHFTNLTCLDDIFREAINGNFINNVSLIKNVRVKDKNDYENAIKTTLSLSSYIKVLENDLASMPSYYLYKVLQVNFAGQYQIESKSSWEPKLSDFDMVKINGNGSRIYAKTDKDDEYKWANLDDGSSMFMVSDLTVEGFNMAVRNMGGTCIFSNVCFRKNKMDYWIEKDYGAGICNAGSIVCINCSFSDNYCKHGGAIFNQGYLEIINCSFSNNDAYGKGDDICNANDGIVIINGTEIDGSEGIVVHVSDISAESRSLAFSLLTISAWALGFAFGSLVGSPALGLVLGAVAGAAVGTLGGALICTNMYDLNFDSVTVFTCIVVACTLTGAFGGAFGSFMASEFPIGCESNIWAENEIVIGPHGYPIHIPDL